MTEMRGEMQILEADYIDFQRLYFRRHWARLWVTVAILYVIIGMVWLIDVLPVPALVGAAIGALLLPLIIWGLSHFVTIPRHVHKLYRESAAIRERAALTCDEEALRFDQESGQWRLKWAEAARWDETETIFAVFPNRALAHILPKRDLSPEFIDFVRARVIASGLTKPWKLRK